MASRNLFAELFTADLTCLDRSAMNLHARWHAVLSAVRNGVASAAAKRNEKHYEDGSGGGGCGGAGCSTTHGCCHFPCELIYLETSFYFNIRMSK